MLDIKFEDQKVDFYMTTYNVDEFLLNQDATIFEEKYFNELDVDPDVADFFDSSQFDKGIQQLGSEFSFTNDHSICKEI